MEWLYALDKYGVGYVGLLALGIVVWRMINFYQSTIKKTLEDARALSQQQHKEYVDSIDRVMATHENVTKRQSEKFEQAVAIINEDRDIISKKAEEKISAFNGMVYQIGLELQKLRDVVVLLQENTKKS